MRALLFTSVSLAVVVALVGCEGERITEQKLPLVREGRVIGENIETVRKNRGKGGELVQQRLILKSEPNDAVLVVASLDANGFAEGASYRREGRKGKRYVELATRDGKRLVFSRGDDEKLLIPDGVPVVLVETMHRLPNANANASANANATATASANASASTGRDVVLLDLENAHIVPARVDAHGALVMPKAPSPPSASDPVLPLHTSKAPFLESETKLVVTWCKAQASGEGALAAARSLALATKPKISEERRGGPPSALAAVQIGGGDDSGAALVVACLRALEHPARVVSGRVGDAETRTNVVGQVESLPYRTWAQVHDGKRWLDVDPLDVELDTNLELTPGSGAPGAMKEKHRALVEGFPGPLTTGLLAATTPR